MEKFRKGFTMVELIFVIVIIGILVSIAMPKLSASRDDAKFQATLASVKQVVSNVQSQYMSDPSSIKHHVDWYGGTFDATKKDGTCIAIFTYYDSGNIKTMYISKNRGHNSCDFDAATEAELDKKIEEIVGVKFGKTNKGESAASYYIRYILSGRKMKL